MVRDFALQSNHTSQGAVSCRLGNHTTLTFCVSSWKCQRGLPRAVLIHSHFSCSLELAPLFWPGPKVFPPSLPPHYSHSRGFLSCSRLQICLWPPASPPPCQVCFASKHQHWSYVASKIGHDSQFRFPLGKHFPKTHRDNQTQSFGLNFAAPSFLSSYPIFTLQFCLKHYFHSVCACFLKTQI